MKWSFSVAVATHAEIAAALEAQANRVVENFKRTIGEDFSSDRYVTDLHALCGAAQVIAQQMPETPGKLFSVNVIGHINRHKETDGILDANSTVRVDLVNA